MLEIIYIDSDREELLVLHFSKDNFRILKLEIILAVIVIICMSFCSIWIVGDWAAELEGIESVLWVIMWYHHSSTINLLDLYMKYFIFLVS